MKKIITFFAFLLAFTSLFAQEKPIQLLGYELQSKSQTFAYNNSRWYCTGLQIDDMLGHVGELSWNYLFPDTTAKVRSNFFGTQTYIHAIGEVLDPKSQWFQFVGGQNGFAINQFMSYRVNSIGVYCSYTRQPQSTSVDTLIFQVREVGNNDFFYYQDQLSPWVMTNYGVDTLRFHPVYHTYGQPTCDTGFTTYKLVLDQSILGDSLDNGIHHFKTAIDNFVVAAGKKIQVSVSFKPGYTWNANVDSIHQLNNIRFLSFEEQGNNTFPYYDKSEWNSSHILTTDWMYDNVTMYPMHAPSFSFSQQYQYEHHCIGFLLSHANTPASPDTIYLLPGGGNDTLYANYSLTGAHVLNNTWMNIVGFGNGKVSYNYPANTSYSQRTSLLKIKSATIGIADRTIVMIQEPYLGIDTEDIVSNLKVYPNPSTSNIYLNFSSTQNQNTQVQIYNLLGELVLTQAIEVHAGANEIELKTENLHSGIYQFEIQIGDGVCTSKIAIQ
jgi:hypothetical protein